MAFNIFETQRNGISYISWDSADTYSWVLVDGELIAVAITEKEISLGTNYTGETIQIITDNSATFDITSIKWLSTDTQIRVMFNSVSTAVQYRVTIDGSVEGYISETGGSRYTFISSDRTTEATYVIDVQWQDQAGNWSSILHAYSIKMYPVPDGQDFSLSAPAGGTIRFTAV